jgi:arabinosaccharide transport system substrate-binding protein
LTTEGQIAGFVLENLYPTYKPAWEDKRLFAEDEYFNKQKPGEMLRDIAGKMPLPSTSALWPKVNDALTRVAISPVMTDKMKVEDALAAVCTEVEKAA